MFDTAVSHKAQYVKNFFEDEDIRFMYWFATSQDLNSKEHVFAVEGVMALL